MKYVRLFILVVFVSAAALLSWSYLNKRAGENIPRKATLVINLNTKIDTNINVRCVYA